MRSVIVVLGTFLTFVAYGDSAQARYQGGMNLYGYVGGMPTNFVDPLGEKLVVGSVGKEDFFLGLLNQLCPEGRFEIGTTGDVQAGAFFQYSHILPRDHDFYAVQPVAADPVLQAQTPNGLEVVKHQTSCACIIRAIKSDRVFTLYTVDIPASVTDGAAGDRPNIYIGKPHPGLSGTGDSHPPGGNPRKVRAPHWIILGHELCGHAVPKNTGETTFESVHVENEIRKEHSTEKNCYGQRDGSEHDGYVKPKLNN